MYSTNTKLVGLLLQPISKTEVNSGLVGAGLASEDGNWNNPSAGTDTFYPMTADANSIKPSDVVSFGELQNATGDGSVFQDIDRVSVSNKTVMPSVSMDVHPTRKIMSALTLLANQFATEGALTQYLKTAEPRNEAIDFLNGNGIVATVQGVDSDGYGFLLENAVVDSLTLVINNTIGSPTDNYYKVSVKFVGRKITRGTTTSKLFATITSNDNIFFGSPSDIKTVISTINFNSGDLILTNICWKSFELTITNNFTPYCLGVDSYIQGFTRNNPEITNKIVIPYNSSTKTILNRVSQGETFSFTIMKYNLTSTDELYFKIVSNYNKVIEDPEEADNNLIGLNLNSKCFKGSGTWFSMEISDFATYLDKVFDTGQTN